MKRELVWTADASLREEEFLHGRAHDFQVLRQQLVRDLYNRIIVSLRNDYQHTSCQSLWQDLPNFYAYKGAGYCRGLPLIH